MHFRIEKKNGEKLYNKEEKRVEKVFVHITTYMAVYEKTRT